jgi:hypothetical protein
MAGRARRPSRRAAIREATAAGWPAISHPDQRAPSASHRPIRAAPDTVVEVIVEAEVVRILAAPEPVTVEPFVESFVESFDDGLDGDRTDDLPPGRRYGPCRGASSSRGRTCERRTVVPSWFPGGRSPPGHP